MKGVVLMAKYLSPKEVAKMLGVSQRTLYRWIAEGRLRPICIAHTFLFEKRALLQQLEDYERGVHAPHDPSLG